MVTDADRLLANGAELTIDGHLFHVRFKPRSLKMLEDEYGSIAAVGSVLQGMADGTAKVIGPIFFVLSLGLLHEVVDGEHVTEDWLLDNGDTRDFPLYAEVAFAALVEALPAGPAVPTKPVKAGRSNGQITSGSRSDTSISALMNSGTA